MEVMPAGPSHVVIGSARMEIIFTQKIAVAIFKTKADADLVAVRKGINNIIIEIHAHAVLASRCRPQPKVVRADVIAAGRIHTAISSHHYAVVSRNAGTIHAHIVKTVGTAGIIRAAGIPIHSGVFKISIIINTDSRGC